MEEHRENPDQILETIEQEEKVRSKGHLKIFFGYAAGVGKTYAMLKAAHAAKRRGVDVVIGYVEPHERTATISLTKGLEAIPELKMDDKGRKLIEFDLDRALERRPQLILVDELAHTNAASCRHAKRYQDIEELLKAGIDVYTTVNVQHIESLNDIIASITEITVRERIPDSVFDQADQVELVDIEPEELMERLEAGKAGGEAQAQKPQGHFFERKNLIALREIALRRCADRVNRIAEKAKNTQNGDFFTEEHILVCLSAAPTNPKIIRTAARMANAFKGTFTALFVETPEFKELEEKERQSLRQNIRLAQQLGAVIETVYGDDIPLQIAEFARLAGVSKVVLGRSNTQRKYIWSKPSLTERLIAYAPNLDVYIIPEETARVYRKKKEYHFQFQIWDAVISVLLLTGVTVVGLLFRRLGFSEANIITVYILGVLLTAVLTTRRVYSLISSAVSVLTFNYFFTRPYFTLAAYGDGYPVTFVIMFLSAFLTSTLAVRMKQQTRQASASAFRTRILLETNQLIQKGMGKEEIVRIVANQLVKLFKREVIIYLAEGEKLREPMVFTPEGQEPVPEYTGPNERAVALWVCKNNKHAGATTNTLGNARCLYLAIRTGETVYGVAGIAVPDEPPDTFESGIMLSILGEGALALENEAALREREQSALLAKNEQLRANLLRSISHDLRTPLTSISGSAGILLSNAEDMEEKSRKKLYEDIYDDSLWLMNLVENLLSVTRIEDGTMRLHLVAELMDEVVAEALQHINRKSVEHKIKVRQEDEFVLARMDARLIVQVIINIVDNAIKYTPAGSEIVITISQQKESAVVEIADNGKGIPDADKERVFEMFYTANQGAADSRRSLGLGLSLCRSIITAHGGEITVADNKPEGTVFRFTLPKEEVRLHES